MSFKLFIIFMCMFFLLYLKKFLRLNKNKKRFKEKIQTFSKNNLNNWMNLTKKERYDQSKKESINYLNKRKVLLEEIRKEYKKLPKGNSEKT